MSALKQAEQKKQPGFIKRHGEALGGLALAIGAIGAISFATCGPAMLEKDRSCTRDGKAEDCSFDMKWIKSRRSCVSKDGKTLVVLPLCTHGGSDCVPGYHQTGSSLGKVRFHIAGQPENRASKDLAIYTVMLEQGPVRSEMAVPSCK